MASTNWYIDCLVASKSDGFASICEKLFAAPVTPSLLLFETIMIVFSRSSGSLEKSFFSESTEGINCPTPFKYAASSAKDESNAFPSEINCAFVAEYGRPLYSKESLEKNRSSSSSTTTGLNKKCILIPSFRDIGVIRSSTFGITNLIVPGNLFSAMTFL